jgi:quercetin dioxygenase-like cupin family protein
MMADLDASSEVGPGYTLIEDLLQLVPEISADTIVSRTIFGDGEMKGILFGFAAGQELSEHTASRPAVLHFLAGKAQLTLGEDSLEARPGTWAHMPAHLPHSIMAHTEVVMLLLLLA